MDDYYRDRKRDTFKPLIQNMAEDMLANGFTNVGPQITKISITDDALTQYIDEFIAFYYDSSVGTVGVGASGIDLFGNQGRTGNADGGEYVAATDLYRSGGESFTTFFLDGELGGRTKLIDDIYDNPEWHNDISQNIPKRGFPAYAPYTNVTGTNTIAQSASASFLVNGKVTASSPWTATNTDSSDIITPINFAEQGTPGASSTNPIFLQTSDKSKEITSNNWGQCLGPNSELFAYFNPHPNMRGSTQAIRDFISPGFPAGSPANGDTHTITGANGKPVVYTYDLTNTIWNGSDGTTHTGVSSIDDSSLSATGSVKGIPFGSGWKDVIDLAVAESNFTAFPTTTGAKDDRTSLLRTLRPANLKDGDFYKKNPPAAPVKTSEEQFRCMFHKDDATKDEFGTLDIADSQTGYVGLTEISRAVYENEFNKVKSLCTHTARGTRMRPDVASGINTQAFIRNYRETVSESGPNLHDFWISNYSDENFFPAGTDEPKKFKGEFLIGFDPTYTKNVFQTGDVYTFNFAHTAFGAETTNYSISVPVVENTVAGFTKAVYEQLVLSTLCDPKNGLYDVENAGDFTPKRNGVLLFESRNIGHNLSSSVTRVARTTSSYSNVITAFTVTDNNPIFQSTVSSITGSGSAVTDSYTEGYVHEIQLRGFDGANNDDEIEFSITGLIDELPNGGVADLSSIPTRTETVHYSTPIPLNSAQLTANIAAKIRSNAYMSKYMDVTANSNAITLRYNRNSSGFMRKNDVGKTHGLLGALASASITSDAAKFPAGTTIGNTSSAEFLQNGFATRDLPSEAQFTVVGATVSGVVTAKRVGADGSTPASPEEAPYLGATLNAGAGVHSVFTTDKTSGQDGFDGDPFNYGGDGGSIEVIQTGLGTSIDTVRLEFPLARDLGTLANPVNGQYAAYVAAAYHKKTSYTSSYEQLVLSKTNLRASGPQLSFDSTTSKMHPNVTHGGVNAGRTNYEKFDYYSKEIPIETFEYITDLSMGPIVLETDKTHKLSGYPTGIPNASEGDQPYRVRLNISRGHEILESSPYISDVILQVRPDQDASNSFEYLQVHAATEFQLKGDGTVSKPEGRDGLKLPTMREPGHMGSLRAQYKGYQESAVHKISPFTFRAGLDGVVKSGFNFKAGIVGTQHYDNKHELRSGFSEPFPRQTLITAAIVANPGATPPVVGVPAVFDPTMEYFSADQNAAGKGQIPHKQSGSRTFVDFDNGILDDGEYRFEDKYLSGSSTELTHDTPFNDGQLRLQKGLFRRTGKSDPNIAPAYPMSYHMTIGDQGIAFYLRDQASTAQADDNAFFVIQRHVHSSAEVGTGTAANPQFPAGFVDMGVDGSDHQPIHCVYQASEPAMLFSDIEPLFNDEGLSRRSSIANQGVYDLEGNQLYDFVADEIELGEIKAMDLSTQGRFRRFVVREKDVLKPWDRHVFAGVNERDSTSIINPLEQLSLNDRGKLVIQFPNRLGSQRFMYTGRELDLIGFCAAGAVGQDTLISSDRMSIGTEGGTGTAGDARRLYRGMMSTGEYGSGMRILLLVAQNVNGDSVMTTSADTRLLDN